MTRPAETTWSAWLTILLLWLAGICAAMQFAKMSIALGELQEELDISAPAVSALMGAAGLFGLIFGVSGAAMARSIGYRRVLLGSLYMAVVLAMGEAALPSAEIFYVLRLLEGVTNLFIVVVAPTLISLHAPQGRLPIVMGLWGTFYGVGFAMTGVFGPWLLATGGNSAVLWGHGVLTLVVALLISRRPLATVPASPVAVSGLGTMILRQTGVVLQAYRQARTSLPGLLFLFHSSIYLGLLIFLPDFAPLGALTQFLLVAMPLISIAGTLAAGGLVQAGIRPERTLLLGFPLLTLILTGLVLPSGENAHSAYTYGFLSCTVILVSGLLQGNIFILAPRLAANAGEEALSFGLIAQLGSLGSVIGPVAFATAIEWGGLPAFVGLVATGASIATLVAGLGLSAATLQFTAQKGHEASRTEDQSLSATAAERNESCQ